MVNGNSTSIALDFGNARMHYRNAVDDRYRMAKQDRFKSKIDIFPEGVSADHNIDSEVDYFLMVERARHIDREDVFAGAAVNRLVNNVLQGGFMLTPASESDLVNDYITARWKDFAESESECDYQREHSFAQLARFVLRDVIVAGDILALPLSTGQIQTVENHRLKTPLAVPDDKGSMTVFGVELDGGRRRVAYWLTEDDIELTRFVSHDASRRVPAYDRFGNRQVLHIVHPKRVTETRGITKFAPVHSSCAMHDDIHFAKLVQQQSVSCWTMVRERMPGFEYPSGVQEGFRTEVDPGIPGQTRQMRDLSAGMMYTGYPGETLKSFASNVPNPTYFDHARQIQQLIAINLELPLVLVLLDASETNYSGWRGALEQAKIAFRQFQSWFAGEFHGPLFRWKMRQWSDPRSPLRDPFLVTARQRGFNVFAHEWVYPTWDTTEPLKDSTDRLLRTSNNLASLRRVHAEVGQNYADEIEDIIADRAMAIELAIQKADELNARYPNNPHPVTWMQCAGSAMPDGFNLNLQADLTPGEPAPTTTTQGTSND